MASKIRVCVIRDVAGISQYIPVEDAVLVPEENIFYGCFDEATEKDGPCGSHSRTICLPLNRPRSLPLSCCHLGLVAPERGWKSICEPIRYSNSERIFISTRQFIDLNS